MGEWRTIRIEDIARKIAMGPFGSNIKVETFVPRGVPIISGKHLHDARLDERSGFNFITEEHAEKLRNCNVFVGDIVFTHAGTIGQVAVIQDDLNYERYVISQRQFYLRVDTSKADPAFVALWFHGPIGRHRLLMHASQVGVPSISRPATNLKRIQIDLPTLSEQRAISEVFGAIDDKIELNRRMNETLEAMISAIFKDCFVNFGPTRARMEGREPYLAEDIWSLFPDALDDKQKPVGWEQKPLDEVADFLNGLALQKFAALNPQDSLPVIKIAELRGGLTEKTSRASRDVPDKYIVKDGDFLFSWSGSLMAKFWTEGEGALNQHLFKVTSNRYPAWFFTQWIHHHLQEFQAIAASKATTMGHIQRRHLKEAMTICPSNFLIFMLGQTLGPLLECAIQNDLEIRTLAATRDLLLPKLMSGEIRLAEAEKTSVEAP